MLEHLFLGRRFRTLSFARSEQPSPSLNTDAKIVSEEEWLTRFDREKIMKEDVDSLIYDFLSMEGQKEAADSFKFETDLHCSLSSSKQLTTTTSKSRKDWQTTSTL